jgi:catechol 2,3-dioxygenase-like lactoylglutathione lyase family enzyme
MLQITGSNVTIMVKDMDASIRFYEQLGLVVKQRWGDHYAMMTAEGITLGIHPASGGETNSGTVSIGFMIDKSSDAKAVLDSNKIAYKEENDGKSGLYLHFKDPDGTIVYFVEPKW